MEVCVNSRPNFLTNLLLILKFCSIYRIYYLQDYYLTLSFDAINMLEIQRRRSVLQYLLVNKNVAIITFYQLINFE